MSRVSHPCYVVCGFGISIFDIYKMHVWWYIIVLYATHIIDQTKISMSEFIIITNSIYQSTKAINI